MATRTVRASGGYPNTGSLSAAQTGNGASTDVVDLGSTSANSLVQITTAVGATPTCTYAVQGSVDGTNWFAIQYSVPATPDTWTVATFTITTAGTTQVFVRGATPFRYLRLFYSANTNVTNTADAYVF